MVCRVSSCGEREGVHVNPILHSLAKGSRVKFTFFYIKEGLSSVVLRSVKRVRPGNTSRKKYTLVYYVLYVQHNRSKQSHVLCEESRHSGDACSASRAKKSILFRLIPVLRFFAAFF